MSHTHMRIHRGEYVRHTHMHIRGGEYVRHTHMHIHAHAYTQILMHTHILSSAFKHTYARTHPYMRLHMHGQRPRALSLSFLGNKGLPPGPCRYCFFTVFFRGGVGTARTPTQYVHTTHMRLHRTNTHPFTWRQHPTTKRSHGIGEGVGVPLRVGGTVRWCSLLLLCSLSAFPLAQTPHACTPGGASPSAPPSAPPPPRSTGGAGDATPAYTYTQEYEHAYVCGGRLAVSRRVLSFIKRTHSISIYPV